MDSIINVKIDKDSIEKIVSEAIIQSAIGDKIENSVKDLLSKSWDNPIDKALNQVITTMAVEIIRSEYKDRIKEVIKEKMAEETIEAFVEKFWSNIIDR